jgi:hypothetical protein
MLNFECRQISRRDAELPGTPNNSPVDSSAPDAGNYPAPQGQGKQFSGIKVPLETGVVV